MSTTSPGWYDDGSGTQRWWDGYAWTEHVQQTAPQAPQAAEASDGTSAFDGTSGADATDSTSDADATDGSGTSASTAGAAQTEPSPPTAAEALAGLDPAAAAAAGIVPAGVTPETPAYPTHGPTDAQVAGYPGGYPGAAGYGAPAGYPGYGPPPPQPPAKKSKLWIVFVVLGVLVIGLIVLATVFIPRLIGTIVDDGGSSGVAGEDEAERAAIVTVERYDDAWNQVDCDLYFDSTTEDYRTLVGLTDCAAFEAEAAVFAESTDEYELTVDSVEREDDVITVTTTESFLSLFDETGEPLATPEAVSTPYEYILIPAGDGWAIDDVS